MSDRAKPVLLAALGLLLLLPGLGRQVVERQQELRVALTAREMVESGNWLVPQYQGEARLRKPPLMYWLTSAAYRVAGTTRSAFAARFPSALAAALLAAVLFAATRKLFDKETALLSSAILFSSFLVQRFARLAETDMTLTLFTSLSALSCYGALRGRRRAAWWSLAGLFAGLGFMIKGPAAPVLPLAATLLYALPNRESRSKLVSPAVLLAPIIFLAVTIPWYAAVGANPEVKEAVQTASGQEIGALLFSGEHPKPFLYYLWALPVALLPWGILLPFAIYRLAQWEWRNNKVRFLFSWLISSLLLLSLLHNKQQHYTLLLAVPSAMMIGRFVSHKRAWHRPVLALAVLLVLAAPAYIFLGYPTHEPKSIIPAFASASQSHLKDAPQVFYVGRSKESFDFHCGRFLQHRENLRQTWESAPEGSLILVGSRTRYPVDPSHVPLSPVMDMQRADWHCMLFVKE